MGPATEPRRVEKRRTVFLGSASPTSRIRSNGKLVFAAALRATSRHAILVINPFAPDNFNWDTSSSTVYWKLSGQMMPPTSKVPKVTGMRSMLFGDIVARTSPLRQFHRSWSPHPNCSALATRRRYVSFAPLLTSTNNTGLVLGDIRELGAQTHHDRLGIRDQDALRSTTTHRPQE